MAGQLETRQHRPGTGKDWFMARGPRARGKSEAIANLSIPGQWFVCHPIFSKGLWRRRGKIHSKFFGGARTWVSWQSPLDRWYSVPSRPRRPWWPPEDGTNPQPWGTAHGRTPPSPALPNTVAYAYQDVHVPPSPPCSRAPSLCPATVPLRPSASFNGIYNRQ